MEAATLIALGAMVISLFLAVIKYLDRRKTVKKEQLEVTRKQFNADVERDSIVIRGAEGALLLMEKTLNTANSECEKRIKELEEENDALRCELKEVRTELSGNRRELNENRRELNELQVQIKQLTWRVDNG